VSITEPARARAAQRQRAPRATSQPRPRAATPPTYFNDGSAIRRVMRERAVALSGARALLMQAAHPLAVAGLLAHSDALEDPYLRLRRTAEVINAITFGTRADADRMTKRVRAMHRSVRGTLPETVGIYPVGTPYRADDPRLLMWILYTLIDSAIVFYETYVGRLGTVDREALWQDYRVVGRLFGLRAAQMPADYPELVAYGRRMLAGDELQVGDWARRRARQIVLEPPVPTRMRPVLETVNFVVIALLPRKIRSQYEFSPLPPAFVRRAMVRAGARYIRRGLLPVLPAHVREMPAARRAVQPA
jgi:uncharacterized protein (DUF2236 family)